LPPTADSDAVDVPSELRWLELFHAGDRTTLEGCYRTHFATVRRAIHPILDGADQETVIHELFSRLISQEHLRRAFQGGSFAAWLATVARNQAIDYRRRIGREVDIAAHDGAAPTTTDEWEQAAQARLLVEQFRRECLPPEWHGVFELRFLQQLPLREAALRLSLHRTTLAYRELRIRKLLQRFLLEEDEP
jgi:RNA polymerase sigma-70 factor (ECF subfamily)